MYGGSANDVGTEDNAQEHNLIEGEEGFDDPLIEGEGVLDDNDDVSGDDSGYDGDDEMSSTQV